MRADRKIVCPYCGRQIDVAVTICPECGRAIWRHFFRRHYGCLRAVAIWVIISLALLLISYLSLVWYDYYVRTLSEGVK